MTPQLLRPRLPPYPQLAEWPGFWGTAAQRPTARRDLVGAFYFASDTGGGTIYQCQVEAGGQPSWVKIAAKVNAEFPVDTVSAPPASSASTGTAGQLIATTSFLYVCVATDTWRRVAIAAF